MWSLAIDPRNTSILYAGSAAGWVSKTSDGGGHWKPTKPGAKRAISTILVDPNRPDTVYIGTAGSGVFKSTTGAELLS